MRRTKLTLSQLEARDCPAAGSSLVTVGSAPGYVMKANTYGRVAVLEIGQAEYDRWAVGQQSGDDTEVMTNRVYRHFGDNFDFVYFVNNEADVRQNANYFGLHTPVRNDTAGIGVAPFNSATTYGSAGRLQGIVHLTARGGIRGGPSLHELMHRWGNYLPEIQAGETDHWGFSSVGGQLGGFRAGSLRGLGGNLYDADGPNGTAFGTFANGGNSVPYSPFELYLMGLIPPEQVPGPIQVAQGASFTDPANGIFSANAIQTVTVQDIIRNQGVRVPGVATSQKAFRAITVVLTPSGLSQEVLDELDTSVELFGKPGDDGDAGLYNFFEATGGRATLQLDGLYTDNRPGRIQFSSGNYLASERNGPAAVTVTRLDGGAGGVTVNFATANGSATSPADYTAVNVTLTFAPGETSKVVTIPVANDGRVEDRETVLLRLTAPGGGAVLNGTATAELAIVDQFEAGRFLAVGTDAGTAPVARVLDATTRAEVFSVQPYGTEFTGGTRVALGDVTGDGVPDLITGIGAGGGPHVKVYDGATRAEVRSFFAYGPEFAGGVWVAAGDVNGDGRADIITGIGTGGAPHVQAFSGLDGSVLMSFYAYAPQFAGGVRVAAGDVDGDGRADIVTGIGTGGGPHARAFRGPDGAELFNAFAYEPQYAGGLFVGAGDVDGDGRADILTGIGPGGGPHVKAYSGRTTGEIASFFAYDAAFGGGVRVSAADANGDGRADLVTGAGLGGGPHVKAFALGAGEAASFFAFDPGFSGGVHVGGG